MKTSRYFSAVALAVAVSGCAGNPNSVPQSTLPAPRANAPTLPDNGLPDRVATAPLETGARSTAGAPQSINVGLLESVAAAPSVNIGAYDAASTQPAYQTAQPIYQRAEPSYVLTERRGTMAPVRDDPIGGPAATPSRATSYNITALKAAYQPSEARYAPAAPPTVRNTPSRGFGQQVAQSAMARLNPNVRYVADYKKIGYPWGDVSLSTGVCTDVVIRTYRSLGIDLQSMVHQDMRRAFSAYPSQRIYGLRQADPNIDHRRVVNLEAFFERVGARAPAGSGYQPGDLITWRLSGGEPHIGVVVNRTDPKTGNLMIVHNLGAGVQAEDLLDYAPPHGHYRFAPDQQSRMASLALKRG